MGNQSATYSQYKKGIWLYVILLIFEGALRKWILPGLAGPLLLIREPIVIWLVFVGFNRGWLSSGYVRAIMWISSISFLMTMLVGHQSILTALYGWRIYLFHIPFIFVVGKILDRTDVLKIGRFILYVSIPMSVLIMLQFYSPQMALVNRGVGGDTEGAGFSGALGFFRPSGTFSFTSGFVIYQLFVGCFLFYFLVSNATLPSSLRIKPLLLWVMLGCFLLCIPYSISRTNLFQSIVVLFFMMVGTLFNKDNKVKKQLFRLVPISIVVLVALSLSGLADDSINAFTNRFETASNIEGGVEGAVSDRYLGGMLDGLMPEKAPFFGFGLGLGTNVGVNLSGIRPQFGFEEEWSRTTNESGMLLGWGIIAVRLIFAASIFKRAYTSLRKQQDMLPWMLSVGVLLTFPQGQLGIPTNLGFSIILASLAFASFNNPTMKTDLG